MSSLNTLRGRLLVQAAFTVLFALAGRSASSGWTVPTIVVGVGCVFIAMAMRPEPLWRTVVTGYVGFTVAYGVVALVSGHYVPGTIVGAYTLFALVQHGAAAFAGPPEWNGSALPSLAAAAFAPPAPAAFPPPPAAAFAPPAAFPPVAPASFPPPAPPVPVAPAPSPAGYVPPQPASYPPPPVAVAAPAVAMQPPVVPTSPPTEAAEVYPEVPAQPRAVPLAMTILPGK